MKASSAVLAAAGKGAGDDQSFVSSVLPRMAELQQHVNELFDSSSTSGGGAGIKQQLEKKEGLFRKHMMVRLQGKAGCFHALKHCLSCPPFLL